MKRYDGSIAVVTGASAGIGRRVAGDLADRGATVVGLARRSDLLAELEQAMKAVSPGSSTRTCDVSDERTYRSALAGVSDEHGRIDILINNVVIEQPTPLADTAEGIETYRTLFETNFFGLVAGTLTVLPKMADRRSGIVVNVSSDAGRVRPSRVTAPTRHRRRRCRRSRRAWRTRSPPAACTCTCSTRLGFPPRWGCRASTTVVLFRPSRSVAPRSRSRTCCSNAWADPASRSTPRGYRCSPRSVEPFSPACLRARDATALRRHGLISDPPPQGGWRSGHRSRRGRGS